MKSSNFIIFFRGKEGTSPLIRLLNNFPQISIIHQANTQGWEPFDRHNCGAMSLGNLKKCLDMIYGDNLLDMAQLNQVYTETAKRPLEFFNQDNSVGFKMRFMPPIREDKNNQQFKKLMFDLLKANNIFVFVTMRRDTLRRALSLYHGDGSGQAGHLQFDLARGKINREEIPKIHVDCNQLKQIITTCERHLKQKKKLVIALQQAGIRTCPLFYEDFCTDKITYLDKIFNNLNLSVSQEEIKSALQKGTFFKKVHSDDISEFVINHEEVLDRFSHLCLS